MRKLIIITLIDGSVIWCHEWIQKRHKFDIVFIEIKKTDIHQNTHISNVSGKLDMPAPEYILININHVITIIDCD